MLNKILISNQIKYELNCKNEMKWQEKEAQNKK